LGTQQRAFASLFGGQQKKTKDTVNIKKKGTPEEILKSKSKPKETKSTFCNTTGEPESIFETTDSSSGKRKRVVKHSLEKYTRVENYDTAKNSAPYEISSKPNKEDVAVSLILFDEVCYNYILFLFLLFIFI